MTKRGEGGAGGGRGVQVEKVPAGVDTVGFVKLSKVIGDPDFKELTNKGLSVYSEANPAEEVPSSYQYIADRFENRSGLKLSGLNDVTFFAKYPEQSTQQEYIGMIFSATWSEDELVDAIESAEEENLKKDTYNGVTVYKENVYVGWTEEGPQYEWRIKYGILSAGNYVVGRENAVKDVIDTMKGDKAAFSGALKQELGEVGSGYLRFAAKVPSRRIPTGEEVPSAINMQAFTDVKNVAGAFSKSGTDLSWSFRINVPNESSAKDIKNATDGIISFGKGMIKVSEIKNELDRISVERSGSVVTIKYETTIDDLKQLMDALKTLSSGGSV